MLSVYWQAIKLAVVQGYRGDPSTGEILGKSGSLLRVRCAQGQQYPTIRLHVTGLPKKAYSVPAHKFMAFVIWGERAFAPGIEVRHLHNDVEDVSRSNLALGTSSQNQLDKPKHVRVAAAKAARAAQGRTPLNAKLSNNDARCVREDLALAERSASGRIRRGVVKQLAAKYRVSASTISLIGSGKTWSA